MALPPLTLNHLNLPARDPEGLRAWYVEKLGFQRHGRFLWSGTSLLVFVDGEPLVTDTFHFGFRLETLGALHGWVERLRGDGVEVGEVEGDDTYSTTYVKDLEGNLFELFFEAVP